jgi:DNA-directed RNA polymerase subunit RPC12/RpoP
MLGQIIQATEENVMPKDASMRAFKCPTCGAPLEPETGTLTQKCPYCGGTVILPESLRTPPPSAGPTLNETFQFGLSGVDLNQIVGNAMHLPQAISLAQQGRVDEAANMYSQITGMEHADAMKAIEDLAAGRAVSLTPGRAGVVWGQTVGTNVSSSSTPSTFYGETFSSSSAPSAQTKRGGLDIGYMLGSAMPFLIVIIVVCSLIGAFGTALIGFLPRTLTSFFTSSGGGSSSNPVAPLLPSGYATQVLSFGTKGMGPGMFTDVRAITVESNGDIVAADYQDGRVQIFDPTGKFLSLINMGSKVIINGLASSRAGNLYVVSQGKIYVYDSKGNAVKTISGLDQGIYYSNIAFGPDDTLYATAEDDRILHFNSNGKINLQISKAFEDVTGNGEDGPLIAVDGLGNMFAVGSSNYLVFKFSPTGKYINQFGGEADPANIANGKFVEPSGIVIDGYGRIFVSDIFGNVQIFDSTGAYQNSFNAEAYGMAMDDQNNVYVTLGDHVEKYQIPKPAGQ